jgi:phosphohistidine phosphatase
MKKLVLLRHAKSSWDDPAMEDHDRPLNKRGRKSAPLIARWLVRRRHLPDTVLCSSAARAQETVALMGSAVAGMPDPVIERALYHARPGAMLDRLAKLPRGCRTAMLVGHNPGLCDLLRQLSDGREEPDLRRALEHFPTAAAAVLEIRGDDWSSIGFGRAHFFDFASPRELRDN